MLERSSDITRQYIDAIAAFEDAIAEAAKVRGGVYWYKGLALIGISRRDPLKRRRDALQAQKVEEVVREYLPQWARD